MTKSEAVALGQQLGLTVKTGAQLLKVLEANGWELALEQPSGDWVVLSQSKDVIARCA